MLTWMAVFANDKKETVVAESEDRDVLLADFKVAVRYGKISERRVSGMWVLLTQGKQERVIAKWGAVSNEIHRQHSDYLKKNETG